MSIIDMSTIMKELMQKVKLKTSIIGMKLKTLPLSSDLRDNM